jgi:hypothetical protein
MEYRREREGWARGVRVNGWFGFGEGRSWESGWEGYGVAGREGMEVRGCERSRRERERPCFEGGRRNKDEGG